MFGSEKIRSRSGWALRTAVVLLAALATTLSAPSPGRAVEPRSLSALEVDRFINDWPRFVEWARERGEEFDRPVAPDAIFEELLSRRAGEYIESLGWVPKRFSLVVERITSLLSGIQMEEQGERIRKAHQAERIELENNPNLTESERAQGLKALDESWARLKECELMLDTADPSEVELVRLNRVRLMKALKETYQGR